jgi:hypothetical protein
MKFVKCVRLNFWGYNIVKMSQNPTIVKLREDLLGDTPSAGLITPVILNLEDADRTALMDALTKNEKDQDDGQRCKDLIFAADGEHGYGPLTPLKKHRAKILCDRLFKYRDTIAGNAEAVIQLRAQIVGPDGTITTDSIQNALDIAVANVEAEIVEINAQMEHINQDAGNNLTISDRISQHMSNITATIGDFIKAVGAGAGAAARGVRDGVRDGATAVGDGAGAAARGVRDGVRDGATSVGDGATTAATAVVDGATASADLADHMAGALLTPVFEMLTTINIPEAGTVGKSFIESIVGNQVDSVLLILQGLMTVGAGAAVAANTDFIMSQLTLLFKTLATLAAAGATGAVLYCIGTATHLLLKDLGKRGKIAMDKFEDLSQELVDLTTSINATTGATALPRLIEFIKEIKSKLIGADADADAVDEILGNLQPALEEVAAMEVAAQGNEAVVAEVAQVAPPLPPAAAQGAKRKLEAVPDAAGAGAGTPGGGKKHAKSQKRPRRKATKSKRSKKAGKKTRKRSRGKSHGKSRGKKH